MAGSSTQRMDNFTAQGMERHQIMMNTEVMKHLRIMNRASVKEIMLQQEKTFKEQVHDLHKLYEVQRLLMDKAKSRGRDAAEMPPALPGCGNVISERTNQGQTSNFWEQVTPNGVGVVKGDAVSPPKTISDRNLKLQEPPKSVNSPVRKRKIDLEQLPEDDSDDEVQNFVDTLNPTSSSLSGNSRELPKVYSGFETLVKSSPGPHASQVNSGLQTLQPVKHLQASSFLSGESCSYMEADGSRGDSSYPSHHGKGPPSLPFSAVKTDQIFTNLGERNQPLQNANMLSTGVSINNNMMFLPQPDLIDRASQETGKQAQWFFQASEANAANPPTRFPSQQQPRLSSHLALPEHSSSKGQPVTSSLDQIHLNKFPFENVGGVFGKPSLERHSPGLPTAAQKELSCVKTQRLGDASKWFTKESFSQGPIGNAVPMARFETGVMADGGHSVPGIMTPAITAVNSKGSSQERDMSLWSSQNPILQIPGYQQPPVFQQQALPPVSQAVWVPSSQNTQHSTYAQQQLIYGLHASDPSQVGYRGEGLQRNQGEIAGPWNMIGFGPYYSSVASTPQKPPFKKPPKLVLKNDGVGMELKLVSPEDSTEKERAIPKKPLNALKRDSLQSSSMFSENKFSLQKEVKEEGHKLDTRTSSEVPILSSTMQAKEHPTKVGAPMEPKLLVTASWSATLAPSQSASTSITLAYAAQHNLGALQSTSGSEIGLGFNLSNSPNGSILKQCAPHLQTVFSSREQEQMADQHILGLKSLGTGPEKETPPQTNASAGKGTQGQGEESSVVKGELDKNSGCGAREVEPSDEMPVPGRNPTDVIAISRIESSTTPLGSQMKCQEDGVSAAEVLQPSIQRFDDVKSNPLQQCAKAESPMNDSSESKTSYNANSTRPTSQLGVQAVSGLSATTDTPCTSRQEVYRFSKLPEDDLSHRVTGKSHTECNNESGSPHSDRDSVPAPTVVSETKSEAGAGICNEELQHDSDTDNLAATILLSFAPKLAQPNEEKQSKDTASEISSSTRKVRPADQGSKTIRCTEAPNGLQSDNMIAGSSQGRRMQGPSSSRKMDRVDHRLHHHCHELMKVTVKDRHKREYMNSAEPQTEEGNVVTKGLMIKLPRVGSTVSDEAIPISRSKHLNKLNGTTSSGSPGESTKSSQKGNEAIHTPTGRRSSRGPPMGTRVPQESRSRLHQQTQHRVEYCPPPPEKDSGAREEGGRGGNKLDCNVKSKAWGELNRTRSSHPRKQFHELSHRKSKK